MWSAEITDLAGFAGQASDFGGDCNLRFTPAGPANPARPVWTQTPQVPSGLVYLYGSRRVPESWDPMFLSDLPWSVGDHSTSKQLAVGLSFLA